MGLPYLQRCFILCMCWREKVTIYIYHGYSHGLLTPHLANQCKNGNWKHCADSHDQRSAKTITHLLPHVVTWERFRLLTRRILFTTRIVKVQVRIQDFAKGRAASKGKSCQHREAKSHKQSKPCAAKVQAHFRALEAFGFLMLKYAFSHILETPFLSCLKASLTPKTDKISTLHCTSINFR